MHSQRAPLRRYLNGDWVLRLCVRAAQGCGRPTNITDRIPKLEAGEGHA
jgi:hypothetical protein